MHQIERTIDMFNPVNIRSENDYNEEFNKYKEEERNTLDYADDMAMFLQISQKFVEKFFSKAKPSSLFFHFRHTKEQPILIQMFS